MFPLKAVREQALAISVHKFKDQFGPVALVQSPAEPVLRRSAMLLATAQTIGVTDPGRVGHRLLVLMGSFDGLSVQFLNPGRDGTQFTVGRLPECDVAIADPSVSKRHATLKWDAARGGCTVRDEGSTNGTFAGASRLGSEEAALLDGDALGFGDAQFLYILTETLYEKLRVSRFGYG